jgi:hypothetical protein
MLMTGIAPMNTFAASHREAPLISMDPGADITDFFMFRSYEPGHEGNVILMMDVIPGEEPSAGPNYYNFDPTVTYRFNIDNNADGKADDVVFEFTFTTEIVGTVAALELPFGYVGCDPTKKEPPPNAATCASVLPPINSLTDPGIGIRQRYTVKMRTQGGNNEQLLTPREGLIAVPSNVGPRTMPNYEALARQGVYTLGSGIRVFAGQRQDPFYIDLGAAFDTLNLRRSLPLLTPAEDANDNANSFGADMLSGFNVHTIALEVPANLLTADGKGVSTTSSTVLGAFASTHRKREMVRPRFDHNPVPQGVEAFPQVQRLANPLVNELIIGTPDKDYWNTLDPRQEDRFLDYYLNPRLATALTVVYGVVAPNTNRQDLVDLLLKYPSPTEQPGRLSELLRLRLNVPPTPFAAQRRMSVLAGDPAGWPNGRRPKDDVTDIAIRVVGGPDYTAARAGDGVNTDDAVQSDSFPFLATPSDGRNRQHQNGTP